MPETSPTNTQRPDGDQPSANRSHARPATLVAATGVEPGSAIAPRALTIPGWPLQPIFEAGAAIQLSNLEARFPRVQAGPWPEPPTEAVLLPLREDPESAPVGVLIAGLSPRLPVNADYHSFLDLVAAHIGARLADATARRHERERIDRLAELDHAKNAFFTNVSHEFQSPLTLLLGPIEQLMQSPDAPLQQRLAALELVQRNARRLQRLVITLLDYSQAQSGQMPMRPVETDLAALTAHIALMFRKATEAAGLELRVDTAQLPRPVVIDPEVWEKIVANLLSNALKFTWSGHIDVAVRALAQHAELTVSEPTPIPGADERHFRCRLPHESGLDRDASPGWPRVYR